jgi:hypothetical protein
LVSSKGSGLPSRVCLHAVEKFGKTSFAAYAPGVIFGMTKGETGLESLIDSQQLSAVPHFPVWETHGDMMESIEELTVEDHKFRTLAIDTLNGAAQLTCEKVCQREYNGDWGQKGFTGYMRGYEVATSDWREFLVALDRLRSERKMAIICLVHTRVKTFKSPDSEDYDRYQPDMHEKLWGLSHKWFDVIMFGNFYTEVVESGTKHKGLGGQQRVLYTERHAAYDAGNRLGLPEEIQMGESGKDAWDNFISAIKKAKKGGVK